MQQQSSETAEEDVQESLSELQKLASFSVTASLPAPAVLQSLQRLMSLYVKMWFNLRTLVFEIFFQESDVLAAAERIQQRLTEMMMVSEVAASTSSKGAILQEMQLYPHEKLQLHIDCLNALGEIISIEDVDDMGGVVSVIHAFFLTFFFFL